MIIRVGTYVGTGAVGNARVTGNAPDFVWIKSYEPSVSIGAAVIATSTMPTGYAKDLDSSAALVAGLVTLTGTGFTPGVDDRVNKVSITYMWLAVEMESGDTEFEVGTYTGNGSDNRNISLATITGTPSMVAVLGDLTEQPMWLSDQHGGDLAQSFASTSVPAANRIQSIGAGTFQVGTHAATNQNTNTYHWFAFMNVANKFQVTTATGDGSDNVSRTGSGFTPQFAMTQARSGTGRAMVMRGPAHVGDQSSTVGASTVAANKIQAFESDGMQVGTDVQVNANTVLYTNIYIRAPASGTTYTAYKSLRREIDPSDWDGTVTAYLEVHGYPNGGTFKARLYNVTDAAAVTGSDVTSTTTSPTRLRSSSFSFASGTKVYEVQYGGDPGNEYHNVDATLIVDVS